ncbi:MAG: type II toxin-antitoxin system VapC family toxin [Ignavibacteria bacterium]|nr:type II toxin-antitoxin system VapC family toxin [Ignavibacteria bacterium]
MKKLVFDSYALLALFRKEKGHEEISQLLTEISTGEKEGFMCVTNMGEVYYITARKQDDKKAQLALDSLKQFPLHFIDADFHLTLQAAKLKAHYKMSCADAFAASYYS